MAKNETLTLNSGAGIDPALFGAAAAAAEPSELDAMKAQIAALLEANAALQAKLNAEADGSAAPTQATSKERFGIIIDEGTGLHDITEVPVQVNGRAYQIRRGMYAEVPREVVSVLKDAVIDKSIAQFDSNGMPTGIKTRKQRRFPFQDFGLVINADGVRVREAQVQTEEM